MKLEDVTEADLIKQGLIDPEVKHPIMSNFKQTVDIWNAPTLVTKKDGTMVSTSLAELYREVPTPQTPACEHLYHAEWGNSGPIMVCAKCGDWHHD